MLKCCGLGKEVKGMEEFDIKKMKEQKDYLIYNRDFVHSYSKAVRHLIDFAMNHKDRAFELGKEQGKEVIGFGANCWPIAYACDVIPLSPPDLVRQGSMATTLKAEEFFQIPAETCYMIKAILGAYYDLKDSSCRRIVASSMRCEPHLTVASMMENYGYQTCIMDDVKRPLGGVESRYDEVMKKYRVEFERLAKWLTGKEIDKEKLHGELVRANRIHDKLQYILKLQKRHPSYMRTLPTLVLFSGSDHFYGQPEEYEKIVDEIILELEALQENEYNDKLVKLMWSGVRGVDFSVYNAVDVSGGCVCGWNLPNSGKQRYDESMDPVDACIKYALEGKYTGSLEKACRQDEEMFRDCGAKGVILYLTLGCTINTIKVETRRRYLNDRNIPTLVLSGTAQIGETTGQVLTRLKAFVEMLS